MKNKYVSFISDEHLIECIKNLHNSYLKAKAEISKKKFYNNKIDTIKLTFDSKFNLIDEEKLIEVEILRQVDKSINNSIGTFHEQILGGIEGYERGNLSGFDIKATDDTLFAIFAPSDISKNISDAVFENLANSASFFRNANLYFVLFDDYSDTNEKWIVGNDEYSVSQKRVFKISLKQFYSVITGQENALEELMNKLPCATQEVLTTPQPS